MRATVFAVCLFCLTVFLSFVTMFWFFGFFWRSVFMICVCLTGIGLVCVVVLAFTFRFVWSLAFLSGIGGR